MMRLVEQGRVALRAPVRQYLPDFRVRDETASREATVWHLLTHTSGWEGRLFAQDRGPETLALYARSMGDLAQLAPIGAVWSYNSSAFVLAGRIIEVITGTDIHQALRDLVFAPLALARSSADLRDVVTYPVALGHGRGPAGGNEVVRPFWMGSGVPGSGMAMSLANMLSFAAFHLGTRDVAGEPLLSLATRRAMSAPQVRKHATQDDMGIGWNLRTFGGVVTAAHGGSGAGHSLLLQLVPERNLAFAILTNHFDGWRLIQDVERATLLSYEKLSAPLNYAIGYRGVTESVAGHAVPLRVQPAFDAYLGRYQRPGIVTFDVRTEGGALVVDGGGSGTSRRAITFYGPDVAYVISGSAIGAPYEFIRAANGEVGWIRVNGQIARKETA
jgi:CubicO group peptidase (beta-lactamase class C family)